MQNMKMEGEIVNEIKPNRCDSSGAETDDSGKQQALRKRKGDFRLFFPEHDPINNHEQERVASIKLALVLIKEAETWNHEKPC